jgi:hypothetical protein
MHCTEGYSLSDVILDTRAPRGFALFWRYETIQDPLRGGTVIAVKWDKRTSSPIEDTQGKDRRCRASLPPHVRHTGGHV